MANHPPGSERGFVVSNVQAGRTKILRSACAGLLLCTLGSRAADLPPDPDNAALLYFQALSLWSNVHRSHAASGNRSESLDNFESQAIAETPKSRELLDLSFLETTERDAESRTSSTRKQTVEIVEAASRIPRCTWGIYHSKGWGLPSLGALRQLAFLLDDDAEALAATGHCREALERSLTIHRLAQHLGWEEIHNYLASLSTDGLAFERIRHVLGSTSPDAETLSWLREQLLVSRSTPQWLVKTLRIDLERAWHKLHSRPETVARIRNRLVGAAVAAKDKQAEDKFIRLTDEELISLIHEIAATCFENFFDSLNGAIQSQKPFAQTYAEIELLTYRLKGNDALDPILPLYNLTQIMNSPRFYSLQTNLRVSENAVAAAIAVYLVKARTGKLPDTLPDGLPKDPFSAQNFDYQKTEGGFVLRFDKERTGELRVRQLEFKVKE